MRLISEYWDLLLAAAGALVVVVLGLADVLKAEHLSEATVGVLAVLSATLVRDRWRRDRLGQAVEATLRAQTSGRPWHVLRAVYTWDLQESGARAEATALRSLRFLTDDIVAISEWTATDGVESRYDLSAASPGGSFVKLVEASEKVRGRRPDRLHRVWVLPKVMRAGEKLETLVSREIRDGFRTSREQVYINVTRPTDSVVMQVIWPADRRPRIVNFAVNAEAPRDITPNVRGTTAGRKKIEWEISSPQVDDEYVLSWEW